MVGTMYIKFVHVSNLTVRASGDQAEQTVVVR